MYSWLDQKQLEKNCHQTKTQQFWKKSGSCVYAWWLHQKPEITLVNHLHTNCELYIVQVKCGIKEMWTFTMNGASCARINTLQWKRNFPKTWMFWTPRDMEMLRHKYYIAPTFESAVRDKLGQMYRRMIFCVQSHWNGEILLLPHSVKPHL